MKKIVPFFLTAIFFLMSCQTPEEGSISGQVPFFDLKEYFAGEIEKLSQKRGFSKSTQINGQKETHDFDSLDFSRELAIFIESDINRVAWLDQYQVDTTFTDEGTLKTITYRALKPTLKTQKLHIAFQQKEPSFIQINRLMENALMNASMQLEYHPGKSYRIRSNQKLRISEEKEMIVEVIIP